MPRNVALLAEHGTTICTLRVFFNPTNTALTNSSDLRGYLPNWLHHHQDNIYSPSSVRSGQTRDPIWLDHKSHGLQQLRSISNNGDYHQANRDLLGGEETDQLNDYCHHLHDQDSHTHSSERILFILHRGVPRPYYHIRSPGCTREVCIIGASHA